jgi:exonuclease III
MESETPLIDATKMQKKEVLTRQTSYFKVQAPRIKVLTYNIWDNSSYIQERLIYIAKLLKKKSPDIVCLTDVSSTALNYLSDILDKQYLFFQVFTTEGDRSGTVLLCKYDTITIPKDTQPYYYDYPDGQPGRILGAELTHTQSGFKFHVLATRLDEDPDNDYIREAQCDVIFNVTKTLKNFILMGDMNIYGSSEIAETKLNKIMNDSWIKLQCPYQIRYTYNGKTNPIIKTNKKFRTSRIYYKSKKLKLKTMSLVGVGYISDEIKIPPSPYYGLEVLYQIKNDSS